MIPCMNKLAAPAKIAKVIKIPNTKVIAKPQSPNSQYENTKTDTKTLVGRIDLYLTGTYRTNSPKERRRTQEQLKLYSHQRKLKKEQKA